MHARDAGANPVHVQLLPKLNSPKEFKLLRPITISPTCINIESRAMHAILEPYGTGGGEAVRASAADTAPTDHQIVS